VTEQLSAVPGIHGTELTPEILSRLPDDAPPAPWELLSTCLLWLAPAGRATRSALQPGVRGSPIAVAGMLVRYEHTPVGAYDEVIGFTALRRGAAIVGHVPFIAVDSYRSIVGGRRNWSLPKTLAAFAGDPVADHAMSATHPEWTVSASARVRGPALPLRGAFTVVQIGPDGAESRARTTARIRARPALVRVRTSGTPALTGWLGSGHFPGLLLERFAARLGAARPV
jgi:hypothetical protein